MSYESALQAAGATVLAFQEFGGWQGEWLAKVELEGETLYIQGSYGSCSGCDAFEAEFRYDEGDDCNKHRYHESPDTREGCPDCVAAKQEYNRQLAEFGRRYLDSPSVKDDLVKQFTKQAEWDSDGQAKLDWLDKN